jgi:Kef-type K+ transport system membrane component KefB
MMAAAGLEGTWVFKKARILAIFDDLDTIILLIPLKMLLVGFKWESIGLLMVIGLLIYLAWKKMNSLRWPVDWYWILGYSIGITAICEGIYFLTIYLQDVTPIQLEILLPAFVLGCMLACHKREDPLHGVLEHSSEKRVKTLIGALFIFLVGLSMPLIEMTHEMGAHREAFSVWDYKIGVLSTKAIFLHVLAITLLSNLGKMFPLFCYKKEVEWKERLALCLGMCPRGEVGAGIIVLALGLITNIDHSLIVIAMLSLALNLILTGPIIMIIKRLIGTSISGKKYTRSA